MNDKEVQNNKEYQISMPNTKNNNLIKILVCNGKYKIF